MNTLFFNGFFYLGDRAWSPGLLVDVDGIIVKVFSSEEEIASRLASNVQRVDMQGQWILPGFEDAHTHPAGRARTLSELDLRGEDIGWSAAKARITERVRETPPNEWIVCHGWNQSTWGNIGQKDLDSISVDHGIFLINISYHGGLLNAKGAALLKEKGVGGEITDGLVTEDLFERATVATAPDMASYTQSIPRYQEKLIARGITAAHDMNVATIQQLQAYCELDEKGLLPIPVVAYLHPRLLAHPEILAPFLGPRKGNFRVAGAKIFLDGAIGTSTAAVHRAYRDGTGHGVLRADAETCAAIVRQAVALGLGHIAIHCIGDRAVDFAITVYEGLRTEYSRDIALWRFEHFEMPDERAIAALAAHDGIASMQPNFSWDTGNYGNRLGDDIRKINPFRSILDAGVALAFGSDDMPSGPIPGLGWAVGKAPLPEQRISMEEAVRAYTLTPAEIVGMGHRRGKIASGYEANFVVIKNDLFAVAPPDIADITVAETWMRGKKIFG